MPRSPIALSFAVLALAACGKHSDPASSAAPPPEAKPVAAPVAAAAAAPAADMKTLKATAAGWSGEYNAILKSWTFEKYTPAGDGTNTPNRIYIDVLPDDVPTTADAYAAKLQQKDWQDIGFAYATITDKKPIDGGFLVAGTVQDTSSPTEKPTLGFVMMRTAGTTKILCKSGVLVSDGLRAEAEALCSGATF
jgi:hypothetical protein